LQNHIFEVGLVWKLIGRRRHPSSGLLMGGPKIYDSAAAARCGTPRLGVHGKEK
jgi:hypothetical protein